MTRCLSILETQTHRRRPGKIRKRFLLRVPRPVSCSFVKSSTISDKGIWQWPTTPQRSRKSVTPRGPSMWPWMRMKFRGTSRYGRLLARGRKHCDRFSTCNWCLCLCNRCRCVEEHTIWYCQMLYIVLLRRIEPVVMEKVVDWHSLGGAEIRRIRGKIYMLIAVPYPARPGGVESGFGNRQGKAAMDCWCCSRKGHRSRECW